MDTVKHLIDNINMKDIVIIYCIFSAIVELSLQLNYYLNHKASVGVKIVSTIIAVIFAPILFPFALGKSMYCSMHN